MPEVPNPVKRVQNYFKKKADQKDQIPTARNRDPTPAAPTYYPATEPWQVTVDDSYRATIYDWWSYLADKVGSAWEYVLPYSENAPLDPKDPRDAGILEQQERDRKERKHLSRIALERKKVVRTNHQQDVNRVKQKNAMCSNWYDGEVEHLTLKYKQALEVMPEPGKDPSKVEGWDVKLNDSRYRGTVRLIELLEDSKDLILTVENGKTKELFEERRTCEDIKESNNKCLAKNKDDYEKIKKGHALAKHMSYENSQCQENLAKMKEASAVVKNEPNRENSSGFNGNDYKPNHQEVSKYQRPMEFGKSDNTHVYGANSLFERLVNGLLFPISLCNPDLPLYGGHAPLGFMRYFYSVVAVFVYAVLLTLLYQVIRVLVTCLPSPNQSEYRESSENKKRKEKKRCSEDEDLSWVERVSGTIRGGFISQSLTYLEREEILCITDPIFLQIHLHKIGRVIEKKLKNQEQEVVLTNKEVVIQIKPKIKDLGKALQRVRKTIKMPWEFLAYITLAVASKDSIGRQVHPSANSLKTMERILPSVERILPSKEICRIAEREKTQGHSTQIVVGDKVLVFSKKVSEVNPINEKETSKSEGKNKTKRTSISRKKAKVARISDLPPLSEKDFGEVIIDTKEIISYRIRVQPD